MTLSPKTSLAGLIVYTFYAVFPMRRDWPIEQKERHPRFDYGGKVRLMVPFSPWRLLLSLEGENLSASGLKAHFKKCPSAKGESDHTSSSRRSLDRGAKEALAIESLIVEGDPYDLQLEHDSEHLPAPVLPARLVKREKTSKGLALTFAFEEANTDLLSLVHELGQTQDTIE